MLRGSTPIQLRQLDISPAIQAGALEQQAITNMYSGIQQGIQNFQEKQEKKQQNEMTVNALKQFVPGLGDDVYKAISKDPQILKSMGDIANIQQARQEQEILATEFEASKADDEALQKAISVNIDTEGNLDKSGLESSYLELGGTNLKLLDLFKEPGEVKVDPETGIITQDGVFKGQVSSKLLLKGKGDNDEETPSLDITPTFNTIEEAEAANLPLGTRVIIGGRDAIIG